MTDEETQIELERAWLMFLSSDYNFKAFKTEAKSQGLLKDVSLDILARMMWGDKVAVFYTPSKSPWALWCATWPITKLLGLSWEAMRHISHNCNVSACDLGGLLMIRPTCTYTTGLTYHVKAPLSRVASLLRGMETTGGDVGHPMIACGPGVLKYMRTPYPSFPNIAIDKDLVRTFNIVAALAGIEQEGKGRGTAKGFYSFAQMEDPDVQWELNPSPEIPAKNSIEDLEGGVGVGLVQGVLQYASAEDRSERIHY